MAYGWVPTGVQIRPDATGVLGLWRDTRKGLSYPNPYPEPKPSLTGNPTSRGWGDFIDVTEPVLFLTLIQNSFTIFLVSIFKIDFHHDSPGKKILLLSTAQPPPLWPQVVVPRAGEGSAVPARPARSPGGLTAKAAECILRFGIFFCSPPEFPTDLYFRSQKLPQGSHG